MAACLCSGPGEKASQLPGAQTGIKEEDSSMGSPGVRLKGRDCS